MILVQSGFIISPLNAQNVYIPDPNFKAFLVQAYDLNQDQEISFFEASHVFGTIDGINRGFTDITGIEAFINVSFLYFSYNQLTFLPDLTPMINLEILFCAVNQLDTLPLLPDSLMQIDVSDNQITHLENPLPKGISYISFNNNFLVELPSLQYLSALSFLHLASNQLTTIPALPDSLIGLYVEANLLETIPADLPPLFDLHVPENNIQDLPALPDTLMELNCRANLLTKLPKLPENLTQLSCGSNYLTDLPALPASLKGIVIDHNLFETLPDMTNLTALTALTCAQNFLSEIDSLPPNLEFLDCSDNALSFLPELPETLTNLACSSNYLTNLPALPPFMFMLICNRNQLSELPELPPFLTSLLECRNNLLQNSDCIILEDFSNDNLYQGNPILYFWPAPNHQITDLIHMMAQGYVYKLNCSLSL